MRPAAGRAGNCPGGSGGCQCAVRDHLGRFYSSPQLVDLYAVSMSLGICLRNVLQCRPSWFSRVFAISERSAGIALRELRVRPLRRWAASRQGRGAGAGRHPRRTNWPPCRGAAKPFPRLAHAAQVRVGDSVWQWTKFRLASVIFQAGCGNQDAQGPRIACRACGRSERHRGRDGNLGNRSIDREADGLDNVQAGRNP